MYFFFQAEDGIRDKLVTGVQTCSSDLDLTKIIETSLWLETILKKPMSSQVAKSGIFPPIETN